MAATRADTSAQRTRASDTAANTKARHATAQRELDALPVTRPAATVNAEIARLKITPRLAPCDHTTASGFGPVSRRVCAQIASLTAEAATTTRRIELQAALAAAERDLAAAPLATSDADPAATALATYLGVLGVPSEVETLSKWLALVPVVALEVGSALAVVLAGGAPARHVPAKDVPSASVAAARDDDASVAAAARSPATRLKSALLEHLIAHGGSIRSGQRGLAKALGTSTTELHRTIHALAASGLVALSTFPSGTELRLLR